MLGMVGGWGKLLCLAAQFCLLFGEPLVHAQDADVIRQVRVRSYLKQPTKLRFKGAVALQRIYYRAFEYVTRDQEITATEERMLGNLRKRIRNLIRTARKRGAQVWRTRRSR